MQRQGQSQKAAPSIQEGNQKLEINPKFRKQTKCLKQEVGGGGGGAGRPKSGEKTRLLFFPPHHYSRAAFIRSGPNPIFLVHFLLLFVLHVLGVGFPHS